MGIIARIKGEEPGIIRKIPHALQGKGHYGGSFMGCSIYPKCHFTRKI